MKKILSLMLVAAMVLSMAVVGNAADTYTLQGVYDGTLDDGAFSSQTVWHFDDKVTFGTEAGVPLAGVVNNATVSYGDTVYFPIVQKKVDATPATTYEFLTSSNDVRGMTVRATWDREADGRSYVEGVSIVKVKLDTGAITAVEADDVYVKGMDNKYVYAVAIDTKDRESTKAVDVYGTIEIRKSKTTSNGDTWEAVTPDFDVDFTLQHSPAEGAKTTTSWAIFDFEENVNLGEMEDMIIDLNPSSYDYEYNYFTVNTIGQSTMLMKTSLSYNSDVADMYPTANLDFFNGYGATFNRIGELTLGAGEAGEDSEIYAWNTETNTLSVIPESAKEYDEWENAWKVNTRTLGGYVISDRELTLTTAPTTPEPVPTTTPDDDIKDNVATGAAL